MGQIILASASPRRKELLEQIGLEFEICPAKGEEVISKSAPEEVVMELSEQKATEVAAMVKTYESGHGELMTPQDILVIGADTVVACDDTILGKPKDEADAKRMLTLLSGRKHAVYTGVTFVFLDKNGRAGAHTFYEKTEVTVMWRPESRWIKPVPMGSRENVPFILKGLKVITIMWSDFRLHAFIRSCKSLESIPIYGKLHEIVDWMISKFSYILN